MNYCRLLCLFLIVLPFTGHCREYSEELNSLMKIIDQQIKSTRESTGIASLSSSVISALVNTPRHEFVPPKARSLSYLNRPLSIGHGQTISQPYIVALMTEILNLKKEFTVLEVGTGSGYQAAVLAPLVKEVHTIEIIPSLAESAQRRLIKLGYKNIHCYTGDGHEGIPKSKQKSLHKVDQFDAIIVTAAATHIPPPLIKILKVGGRMIIPVGGTFQTQNLVLLEKTYTGVKTKNILPVRFVPLIRK